MICAPGIARQHVGGKQHQLAVRIDDLAVFGDHAEPVAVAVEGQAQSRRRFRAARGSGPADSPACAGSGWWFGKVPSTSQNSSIDFAAHAAIQFGAQWRRPRRCRSRSRSSSGAASLHIGERCAPDSASTTSTCVSRAAPASATRRARRRRCAGAAPVIASPCKVSPASIIFRPLYSGGLWLPVTATPLPVPSSCVGEVEQRRRHHADVDDVDAAGANAVGKRRDQASARRAGRRGRRRWSVSPCLAAGATQRQADRAPLARSASCRRCRGCRRP